MFPLHNLGDIQCANAITPANQTSNHQCGIQGSLHVVAGHSMALLGRTKCRLLLTISRMSHNLPSLSDMLELTGYSKPRNYPQHSWMVGSRRIAWHRVRCRRDHLYCFKSLFYSA